MKDPDIKRVAEIGRTIMDNIERIIVGKRTVIELVLVSICCEGHILLEDVPGIGKTMLARSVARSLKCRFRRIQCTPDLLPSDITGTYIFNQKNSEFEFRPGPVFAQVVLADEINRATPRSQSALLEAMEERQVTLEGETRSLPRPFLVLATQNPVELEGTFPLPEAQMDRFLLRLSLGYTTESEDEIILDRFAAQNPIEDLTAVIEAEEVLNLQKACRKVLVTNDIRRYMIRLVHATRQQPHIELGASPRAMLGIYRTSQALAAIRGRAFVMPDDVKYLAPFVMAHRIITETSASLKGRKGEDIIREVLEVVPAPVEAEPEMASRAGN
ncbi:MAG: MoxR family ATPase [Dehalococcoidales bacterium]|nr:MoxR family ATPase [Dehalococcoidales bacterium]